ncbi:hypothetical protein [Candidatus Cytomitobacter indipagum]|nr:hypothetical protein [Candidatus Cytomitobacter indipagum]
MCNLSSINDSGDMPKLSLGEPVLPLESQYTDKKFEQLKNPDGFVDKFRRPIIESAKKQANWNNLS